MIHNWVLQWKINFNPDPTKQAQEVIFSRKTKKLPHPPLVLKIYKAFVRPYLDHGDILYNQAFNFSFQQELESIGNNWRNKEDLQREDLPRTKVRITSITTMVQKTSNVLQNLSEKESSLSF